MEYTTKEVVQKCLDDLSRENLIGNENDTFISLAEAKDRIEELPTADVVPKSEGEWRKRGNEKTCSLCKFIYYSNNDEWNFCPNCGARMRGADNEQRKAD